MMMQNGECLKAMRARFMQMQARVSQGRIKKRHVRHEYDRCGTRLACAIIPVFVHLTGESRQERGGLGEEDLLLCVHPWLETCGIEHTTRSTTTNAA